MELFVLMDGSKIADLEKGTAFGNLNFKWAWTKEDENELSDDEYKKYLEDCRSYLESREKKTREILRKMRMYDISEEENAAFKAHAIKWKEELVDKFSEKFRNALLDTMRSEEKQEELRRLIPKLANKQKMAAQFALRTLDRWDQMLFY